MAANDMRSSTSKLISSLDNDWLEHNSSTATLGLLAINVYSLDITCSMALVQIALKILFPTIHSIVVGISTDTDMSSSHNYQSMSFSVIMLQYMHKGRHEHFSPYKWSWSKLILDHGS
jgi:hypothetical protein